MAGNREWASLTRYASRFTDVQNAAGGRPVRAKPTIGKICYKEHQSTGVPADPVEW